MRQSLLKTTSVILLALLATNCATIFKGSSAEVRLSSTPSNAEVYVNGFGRGETPTSLNLQRDDEYTLTFKKEGYEDVKVKINKKFDVATTIVGNVFSWSIGGVIVDLLSGAAYTLTPADIHGHLDELEEAGFIDRSKADKDGIHVFMLTKEEWKKVKADK